MPKVLLVWLCIELLTATAYARNDREYVDMVFKRKASSYMFIFTKAGNNLRLPRVLWGSLEEGFFPLEQTSMGGGFTYRDGEIDLTFRLPDGRTMTMNGDYAIQFDDVEIEELGRTGKILVKIGQDAADLPLVYQLSNEVDDMFKRNQIRIGASDPSQLEGQIYTVKERRGFTVGLWEKPEAITIGDNVTIIENRKKRIVKIKAVSEKNNVTTLDLSDGNSLIELSSRSGSIRWNYKDGETGSVFDMVKHPGSAITAELLATLDIEFNREPLANLFSDPCGYLMYGSSN